MKHVHCRQIAVFLVNGISAALQGQRGAVPLPLAAGAPGPTGLGGEGHELVEPGRRAEADLEPSLLLLLLLTARLCRPKSRGNGSLPGATAGDLSSWRR